MTKWMGVMVGLRHENASQKCDKDGRRLEGEIVEKRLMNLLVERGA